MIYLPQATILLLLLLFHTPSQSQQTNDPCSSDFRSPTGYCNNRYRRDLGSSNRPLLRSYYQKRYTQSPVGLDRPNPSNISRTLCSIPLGVNRESKRGLTELATFFGQWLDHMMVRTAKKDGDRMDFMDGRPFLRSKRKWKGVTGGWSPINFQSGFIDGSLVYGVEEDRRKELRVGEGGLLKVGKGFLIRNARGLENDPNNGSAFGLAGDSRANENPGLTSFHVLFVREHNDIAEELKEVFGKNVSKWDDELLFQTARKINAAQMQKIVYEEFLPAFFGNVRPGLPTYSGYKTWVDPTVSLEFATAAFRIGHSMIADDVTVIAGGQSAAQKIPLREHFFNHGSFRVAPIEDYLRGMMNTVSQEVDLSIADTLRNVLFARVKEIEGIDLAAINIQRGRDHALPDYNKARELFGLQKYTSFDQITTDQKVVSSMKELYNDTLDNIDLWVGCLAEDKVPGSSLGELTRAIWIEEFRRNRDGDRFFYTNPDLFPPSMKWSLRRIQRLRRISTRSTLRDIIARNTDIRRNELPRNLFIR